MIRYAACNRSPIQLDSPELIDSGMKSNNLIQTVKENCERKLELAVEFLSG